MTTIIERIQRDALDKTVTVSNLLRLVKLAASKLGLGSVEDWVELELNGYRDLPVPDYRIIHGRPMAQHPLRGWEPIGGAVEAMSIRHIAQSVASLEELAAAPAKSTIHFPYPDSILKKLNEANNTVGWLAVMEVHRSAIIPILDRVRTMVLDWALKMEQAGVAGTEISFDAAERAKAQSATTTINIGAIGSFAGNLGVGNAAGDVKLQGLDLGATRRLVDQLRAQIADLTHAGADGATLNARLNSLEAELLKPSPAGATLRGLLVDVRNAVAGAAGNLIAIGVVTVVNQILGTGVPSQ